MREHPACFGEPTDAVEGRCDHCPSLHECMEQVATDEGIEDLPLLHAPLLPRLMRSDRIYKGSDGRWYTNEGVLVSRKQRRRAGVK